MVNIVLMCAGGMSTSVLVRNIRKAAEEEGFACNVNAYSVGEARKVGPGADVVLLGPQVSYLKDRVRREIGDVPMAVIEMRTYGRMDGKAVLGMAKELLGLA